MNAESQTRLIDIDWQPSARKVRQFAACLATLVVCIAWLTGSSYLIWAGLVAGLVVVSSWLAPALIKPLYVALMLVTLPIGLVVGEAALIAIYVGVFLPIGMLFRWMRRDALQRTIDRSAVSYWEESRDEQPKKSYLRRY